MGLNELLHKIANLTPGAVHHPIHEEIDDTVPVEKGEEDTPNAAE